MKVPSTDLLKWPDAQRPAAKEDTRSGGRRAAPLVDVRAAARRRPHWLGFASAGVTSDLVGKVDHQPGQRGAGKTQGRVVCIADVRALCECKCRRQQHPGSLGGGCSTTSWSVSRTRSGRTGSRPPFRSCCVLPEEQPLVRDFRRIWGASVDTGSGAAPWRRGEPAWVGGVPFVIYRAHIRHTVCLGVLPGIIHHGSRRPVITEGRRSPPAWRATAAGVCPFTASEGGCVAVMAVRKAVKPSQWESPSGTPPDDLRFHRSG